MVSSSEEPILTASNLGSSNNAAKSSVDQRDSGVDGTRLVQAYESIGNRAGTGNDSSATVPKHASLGIRESVETGKAIKVQDTTETSKMSLKQGQESIVKDLKWKH